MLRVSQSHRDKKVTFTVTLANGRQVTIGEKNGTYVSQALAAIRAEGGIEDWAAVTMKSMYQARTIRPEQPDHRVSDERHRLPDQ